MRCFSATAADGSPLGEVLRAVPAGASVQIDRVLRLFTGSAVRGVRVTLRAEGEPQSGARSRWKP